MDLPPWRRHDQNRQIKESFSWRSCEEMRATSDPIGKICDIHGKVSMVWTIPGYFTLPQKTDTYYESPPFVLSSSTWCIRIYPNGQRCDKTVEWVGLYLRKRDPVVIDQDLTITLGMRKSDGLGSIKGQFCKHFMYATLHGYSRFIGREKLKSAVASDGALTIFCVASISIDVEAATQTTSVDSTHALINDFRSLFLNRQNTDVIFRVRGQEFRAHKLILQSRSSVLDTLFQHDWKGKNNIIIQITNCDSKTFHEFLLFVYTGKIENLTLNNVADLYSVSDKYQVKELKERCFDFMKNNLTLDTVCDIIAMADRLEEEELKKSAKELLIKNIKEILPTEKWKSFMAENAALAVELLMVVIPGDSS